MNTNTVTTSPELYREQLKRGIAINYRKLEQARAIPDNEQDITLYTDRMNIHLESLHAFIGEMAAEHE